jgi:hypothetical protein
MNQKMKITAKALVLLERIIRSCPPRMSNSGREAKNVLYKLSQRGEDLSWEDFLGELKIDNLSESVFGHFHNTAECMGVDEIDECFVVEYFSGEFHFKEIVRKIENNDVKLMEIIDPFARERISVAHLLRPGFLEDISGEGFSVRYENGDNSFITKNLFPYKADMSCFEKGSLVWIHLVSIIGLADRVMAKVALDSQEKNQPFIESCKPFLENGLDAGLLSTYSAWAENACGLFCE